MTSHSSGFLSSSGWALPRYAHPLLCGVSEHIAGRQKFHTDRYMETVSRQTHHADPVQIAHPTLILWLSIDRFINIKIRWEILFLESLEF